MESFAVSYAKQILKHFKVYANWRPFNPIRLGDFGYINNGIFERKSNIAAAFGLSFSKRSGKQGNLKSHMMFSTEGSTGITFLAKGDSDYVNGGLKISFKNKNSFFVNLAGVYVEEIEDQVKLSQQILGLYMQDKWDGEWTVITSTVHSNSTIILGSMNAGNSFMLEAKSNIKEINLADASLEFSITNATSLDLNIISEPKLIPFMGLSKIRNKFLKGTEFNFSSKQNEDNKLFRSNLLSNGFELGDYFEFAKLQDW